MPYRLREGEKGLQSQKSGKYAGTIELETPNSMRMKSKGETGFVDGSQEGGTRVASDELRYTKGMIASVGRERKRGERKRRGPVFLADGRRKD